MLSVSTFRQNQPVATPAHEDPRKPFPFAAWAVSSAAQGTLSELGARPALFFAPTHPFSNPLERPNFPPAARFQCAWVRRSEQGPVPSTQAAKGVHTDARGNVTINGNGYVYSQGEGNRVSHNARPPTERSEFVIPAAEAARMAKADPVFREYIMRLPAQGPKEQGRCEETHRAPVDDRHPKDM